MSYSLVGPVAHLIAEFIDEFNALSMDYLNQL